MGDVAWVDNFAVWICADGRYEETACDTPNVLVLKIAIKDGDGDGDSTDDVINIGDDDDDWPADDDDDDDNDNDDDDDDDNDDDDDDDDAKYDVCTDGDNEGGGGDITDDDKENDIDTVTNEDDDETVGVGGALSVTKDKEKRKNWEIHCHEFSDKILYAIIGLSVVKPKSNLCFEMSSLWCKKTKCWMDHPEGDVCTFLTMGPIIWLWGIWRDRSFQIKNNSDKQTEKQF